MDTFNDHQKPPCSCSDEQPRTRTLNDGRVIFGLQCINCGKWTAKSKSSFSIFPTIAFDESIRVKFQERLNLFRESQASKRRSDWFAWYSDYLKTPQWQSKRLAVLKRDRYLCQGCMSRRASQVHHLSYEHCGNELLWELTSVCDDCHKKIHPHMQEAEIDWENFR